MDKTAPLGADSSAGEMGQLGADSAARFVSRLRQVHGLGRAAAQYLAQAVRGCPVRDRGFEGPGMGKTRGVFPLPYVLGRRTSEGAADGVLRAGQRRRERHHVRVCGRLNFVVASLNLLYGGAACAEAGFSARCGAAQQSALARLQPRAAGWTFQACREDLETLLHQPVSDYGFDSGLHAAVDTDPDLVKLPKTVAGARLLDLLPGQTADLYADESNIVKGGWREEAAAVVAGRAFWSPPLREPAVRWALIRRLWEAGMLRRLDSLAAEVGLFTVRRSDGLQRLVVDPRQTNAAWEDPASMQLAVGPQLAQAVLRYTQARQRPPRMLKSDLSDYYYNLVTPDWMHKWFGIRGVPEWVLTGGRPEIGGGVVNLGFRVLPMGASHAVLLAQLAHRATLLRAGLPPERELLPAQPLPTTGPIWVLVIDDLVILEDPDGADSGWLDMAMQAYKDASLPVASGKVALDATAALGMERCGNELGAPRVRRQRLTGALLEVASWGRVAPRLLEVLMGHAVWACLFKRLGLSALQSSFHVGSPDSAFRPVAVAPEVRWELITLAALLPLLTVSLDSRVADVVLATDACAAGFGVVEARPEMGLVVEALRYAELRGEHSALDGGRARRPAQADRVLELEPLPGDWAEVKWRTRIARPWRTPPLSQAVAELQAIELAVEFCARNVAHHDAQFLGLVDARSALGALAKGRSSSWQFLRVMRRIAAQSLATGVEFVPRWVSSEQQPADEASRRFERGRRAAGRSARDSGLGMESSASDAGDGPGAGARSARDSGLGLESSACDAGDGPGAGADGVSPGNRRRPLKGARLAPSTVQVYLRAFLAFASWAAEAGMGNPRDCAALDDLLCAYFEHQYEEGRGPSLGAYVLGAVKLLSARTYGALFEARLLHVDWLCTHKVQHWAPLSLPLVLGVACFQFERGATDVGMALLVTFAGLLRISEITRLKVQDVVFPGDVRLFGLKRIVLVLKHTKTGDDASAELRFEWLFPFVAAWVQHRRTKVGAQGLLAPSAQILRSALAESLASLGAPPQFVMHSLRAGGALDLLVRELAPIDEVLRLGRWRRPESARPYLQRLRALAVLDGIPPRLGVWIRALATDPRLALAVRVRF